MSEIAVVYWSGTGNTEIMAQEVAEGIRAAGAQAKLLEMEETSAADLSDVKVFALGCPSMGDEELENTIVEPFVNDLEGSISGKRIALFGSYGWGDGEWMRNWVERMEKAGAKIVGGEGVICNEEPDDEAKSKCQNLGKSLAEK